MPVDQKLKRGHIALKISSVFSTTTNMLGSLIFNFYLAIAEVSKFAILFFNVYFFTRKYVRNFLFWILARKFYKDINFFMRLNFSRIIFLFLVFFFFLFKWIKTNIIHEKYNNICYIGSILIIKKFKSKKTNKMLIPRIVINFSATIFWARIKRPKKGYVYKNIFFSYIYFLFHL